MLIRKGVNDHLANPLWSPQHVESAIEKCRAQLRQILPPPAARMDRAAYKRLSYAGKR
jgi:hypothetical protein